MKHSDKVISFIDSSINAAKLRDGKRTEFRLKTTRGNIMERLVLELSPPAGKATRTRRVWRIHYDMRLDGQRVRRKIKIGDTTSALSHVEAKWREIKVIVDSGGDWQVEEDARNAANIAALTLAKRKAYSFEDLAAAYIERHAKVNKRSWRDDQRKLRSYVLPAIGSIAADTVTKRDIISIIDGIAHRDGDNSAPVQADRVKALLSSIFNWGRDEDLVQSNPAERIRKRSERKRRTRVLSSDEIRNIWRYMDTAPASHGQSMARTIIKLAFLLGQRRSQIAGAERCELVALRSTRAAWHIPHARNKNEDDLHVVPLPSQSEMLFGGGVGRYVFPSDHRRKVPIHPDTVTEEFATIRRKLEIKANDAGDEAVFHCIRHTIKTEMSKLGIAKETRQRIMSHRSKSASSDMDQWYNHHDHYDEDRRALEAWQARLMEIVMGEHRVYLRSR